MARRVAATGPDLHRRRRLPAADAGGAGHQAPSRSASSCRRAGHSELVAAQPDGELFGVLLQYPGASGAVRDLGPAIEAAHGRGAVAAVAADLLALTLLRPPGEFGADIAVGTAQRFGVPMGFGGPHAGYICVRDALKRQLPGRLVGVSVDADGHPAYRLALQAREQHIRREKATSNICTAQVLLAVISAMYAAYHGPDGLTRDRRTGAPPGSHARADAARRGPRRRGRRVLRHGPGAAARAAAGAVARAREAGFNLYQDGPRRGAGRLRRDHHRRPAARGRRGTRRPGRRAGRGGARRAAPRAARATANSSPTRSSTRHRSETAMLRYLRRLADFDIALDRSMIPLGSCTMKLNAAAEMEPITWPEFAGLHPFAPAEQAAGYLELIGGLQDALAEITGYDAVSLQPNAGSQGELPGCSRSGLPPRRSEPDRDVCLIPRVGARDERGQRGHGRPAGCRRQVRPPTARSTSATCGPSWTRTPGASRRSC